MTFPYHPMLSKCVLQPQHLFFHQVKQSPKAEMGHNLLQAQLAGHTSCTHSHGVLKSLHFRVPPSYSGLKSVSTSPSFFSSPQPPPPTVLPPEAVLRRGPPHSPWSSWQSDCAASGGLGHAGSSHRSLYGSGGITPCCGLSSQTSREDKRVQSSQKGHGSNSAKLSELLEGK